MGLIINDEITLENGMTVTGAYLSFRKNSVAILPGLSATIAAGSGNPLTANNYSDEITTPYTACGTYNIWFSQDAAQRGLKPIQFGNIDYQITKEQTESSLHTLLYSYIKTHLYTNTTDV
jgi:hypothetical protein